MLINIQFVTGNTCRHNINLPCHNINLHNYHDDVDVLVLYLPGRPEFEPETTRQADLHPLPDPGAGEGVQVQPLLDPEEKDWTQSHAVPDREANQDLVSKQENEGEERGAGHKGAERNRKDQTWGIPGFCQIPLFDDLGFLPRYWEFTVATPYGNGWSLQCWVMEMDEEVVDGLYWCWWEYKSFVGQNYWVVHRSS